MRGMSLIELLVAMAVGALLMVLLNSVLSSTQSGWRRAKVSAAASDEHLAGAQFLFASISAALPPDPLDQNTWFHGTPDLIEFLAVPPAADAFRGPVIVRLYSKLMENGRKTLVVEMGAPGQKVLGQVGQGEHSTDAMTLFNGLESAKFEFFEQRSGLLQEVPSWNDQAKLPKLIRIDISFLDKNLRPMRLAISPRRTVSGRCIFDLISLGCRT